MRKISGNEEKMEFSLLLRYKDRSISLVDGKFAEFEFFAEKRIFLDYQPFFKKNLQIFSYSGLNYRISYKIYDNSQQNTNIDTLLKNYPRIYRKNQKNRVFLSLSLLRNSKNAGRIAWFYWRFS